MRSHGALYSVYVRGQGYLAAGRLRKRRPSFEESSSHRRIVLVDPVDAMARLQLARALALSGRYRQREDRLPGLPRPVETAG